MRHILAAGVLLAVPVAGAAAQVSVGYPPAQSPFHDLLYKQSLTPFAGYYLGNTGSVGVAPKGGPAVGVRYEIRVGGPATFTARYTQVFTSRTVKNPLHPEATRVVGTQNLALGIADVGISFALTGQRSWHGLVPALNAGIGLSSDLGKGPDVGGYQVGTAFAFVFGAGLRWVPSNGRTAFRLDLSDYFYQTSYPNAYTVAPANSTAILGPGQGTTQWLGSPVVSLGVSYQFSR